MENIMTLESLRFASMSAAAHRLLSLFKQCNGEKFLHNLHIKVLVLNEIAMMYLSTRSLWASRFSCDILAWMKEKSVWAEFTLNVIGFIWEEKAICKIWSNILWSAILTVIWESSRKAYCSVWNSSQLISSCPPINDSINATILKLMIKRGHLWKTKKIV